LFFLDTAFGARGRFARSPRFSSRSPSSFCRIVIRRRPSATDARLPP